MKILEFLGIIAQLGERFSKSLKEFHIFVSLNTSIKHFSLKFGKGIGVGALAGFQKSEN